MLRGFAGVELVLVILASFCYWHVFIPLKSILCISLSNLDLKLFDVTQAVFFAIKIVLGVGTFSGCFVKITQGGGHAAV